MMSTLPSSPSLSNISLQKHTHTHTHSMPSQKIWKDRHYYQRAVGSQGRAGWCKLQMIADNSVLNHSSLWGQRQVWSECLSTWILWDYCSSWHSTERQKCKSSSDTHTHTHAHTHVSRLPYLCFHEVLELSLKNMNRKGKTKKRKKRQGENDSCMSEWISEWREK